MRDPAREARNRIYYLIAALAVIALGLASRRVPNLFLHALGKYPGDALWTIMVFTSLGAVFPRASSARLAVWALTISFIVEFTQLYQAPWINSIRSMLIGHLVLGSGFSWIDLLAYSVGASVAFFCEWTCKCFRSRFTPSKRI